LIFQDRAGTANRFFRIDGAVSLDINQQFIQVGALFNTCRFNAE